MKSFDVQKIDIDLYANKEPLMVVSGSIQDRLFTKKMGSKMLLKPFFFRDDFPRFEKEDRSNSVYFSRGYSSVDTVDISIPQGMTLNEPLPPIHKSSEFGSLDLECEFNPEKGQILVTRKVIYKEGEYGNSQYPEIKDFFDSIQEAADQYLVLIPQ